MAYTLKLTDGRILLNLPDQKTDQLTTSLTLIGKNVPAYGQYYNENFIRLLENFANSSEPTSPLIGQLWYDTRVGRIFVYNAKNQFRPVGGPIVSPTEPTFPTPGDLWLDSVNKRLYVYDNQLGFIVAGQSYAYTANKSGWIVEELIDKTTLGTRSISSLYNNGSLLAIMSDVSFTPSIPYNGISYIGSGLTMNPTAISSGTNIIGTITNALSVNGLTASQFIKNYTTQTTTGALYVKNDDGIQIGSLQQDLQLHVTNDGINVTSDIYAATGDSLLTLSVKGVQSLEGTRNAIVIDPHGLRVGVWNSTPGNVPDPVETGGIFDINADTTIRGNLTVIGNSKNVEVVDLQVQNKNIELAFPSGSVHDSDLTGGGITLWGDSAHNIVWNNDIPGWSVNDNFNVEVGSAFYASGVKVLDGTGLYATAAPNLQSIGTLTNLFVGNISISTSTISTYDDSDLVLGKDGFGLISANNKRIKNVGNPTSNKDAVNKDYVDNIQILKASNSFAISIDVTGQVDINTFVISMLNKMLPIGTPVDFWHIPDLARCRVNCIDQVVPAWTVTGVTNGAYVSVDKNNVSNAVNVLTDVEITVTSPPTVPVVSQIVRQFIVNGGKWSFDQVIT